MKILTLVRIKHGYHRPSNGTSDDFKVKNVIANVNEKGEGAIIDVATELSII